MRRNNMASIAGRPLAGRLVFRRYIICLVLCTAPFIALGAQNSSAGMDLGVKPRFLPVNRAFRLSVSPEDRSISVRWYISPGYYLYRGRLGFSSPDATLGKPELPKGQEEQDPYFGKVVIYRDELLVTLPIVKSGKRLKLEVRYQGCADAGYCYPPQKRLLNVTNVQ